jgi:hypothetical protein
MHACSQCLLMHTRKQRIQSSAPHRLLLLLGLQLSDSMRTMPLAPLPENLTAAVVATAAAAGLQLISPTAKLSPEEQLKARQQLAAPDGPLRSKLAQLEQLAVSACIVKHQT